MTITMYREIWQKYITMLYLSWVCFLPPPLFLCIFSIEYTSHCHALLHNGKNSVLNLINKKNWQL